MTELASSVLARGLQQAPETELAILFHRRGSTQTTHLYNKLPEEVSLDEIERSPLDLARFVHRLPDRRVRNDSATRRQAF